MLTKRIIPCLDVMEGRVVKGINFVKLRDAGDPVENARIYEDEGADEITFLDITASHEGRGTMINVVEKVAQEISTPLTVGGGVKNIEIVKKLLRAGADKVTINSAAFNNPNLIKQIAKSFGSQCIVASIDAKKRGDKYECFSYSGKQATGISVSEWAKELEDLGAGNYDHMYMAIAQANVSAVAAASIFHFTHQTPLEAKNYLFSKGIFVRKSIG